MMEAHMADMTPDLNRPSFFELVAQESMGSMLKPALRHLITVMVAHKPHLRQRLLTYHNEIYAAMMLIIQLHYLRTYQATLFEFFYGLKRVVWLGKRQIWSVSLARSFRRVFDGKLISKTNTRYTEAPANAALSRSLFLVVVMPYIKVKLDAWYNELRERQQQRQTTPPSSPSSPSSTSTTTATYTLNRMRVRIEKLFRTIYPFLHFSGEGAFFVYQVLYLFGHTRYYSPFGHLAGLELKRVTMNDIHERRRQRAEEQMERTLAHHGPGILNGISRILSKGAHTALDYSKFVLLLTIFFFKFLEWWYSEHGANFMSLPVPPPPNPPMIAADGTPIPENASLCPLCLHVRTNPAFVTTSGFSFCYPCIHEYIAVNSRCPITHAPTSVEQITKLYASSAARRMT